MHPAELEAKSRARDELQHALRARKSKKARAEGGGEGAARGGGGGGPARRLAIEQERLREAFEREQAIERAKAEERMRAEEEAFQAAAEKRRERKLVDMPEPRDARRRRAATRRRKRRAFRRGFRITRTPARLRPRRLPPPAARRPRARAS